MRQAEAGAPTARARTRRFGARRPRGSGCGWARTRTPARRSRPQSVDDPDATETELAMDAGPPTRQQHESGHGPQATRRASSLCDWNGRNTPSPSNHSDGEVQRDGVSHPEDGHTPGAQTCAEPKPRRLNLVVTGGHRATTSLAKDGRTTCPARPTGRPRHRAHSAHHRSVEAAPATPVGRHRAPSSTRHRETSWGQPPRQTPHPPPDAISRGGPWCAGRWRVPSRDWRPARRWRGACRAPSAPPPGRSRPWRSRS